MDKNYKLKKQNQIMTGETVRAYPEVPNKAEVRW